jgi:HlyD family secretion protein
MAALALIALAGLACASRSEKAVITASGTIEAVEVNVASNVAGQLLTLAVDEGARVEPGHVLATVDHATADPLAVGGVDAGSVGEGSSC